MTEYYDFQTHSPRRVIVQMAKAYDDLFCGMMARLRADFGTQFILLSNGPKIRRCYEEHLGDGDIVVDVGTIHGAADAEALADPEGAFLAARKYESAYGIAYLRDVVQQDRQYSPRFLSNAPYYPLSPGELPSLAVFAARINTWFALAEKWLDYDGADLLFVRPDGIVGAPLVFAAERRGVPVTVPVSARYKGRATWTFGGYRLGHFVQEAAKSLVSLPHDHETNAADVRYTSITFNNLATMARPVVLTKKIAKSAVSRVIMCANDLRAWRRSQRTSFLTEIRRTVNVFRIARWLEEHTTPVETLRSQPYVLYLMNVEPEVGSHALAREFWNSLAIIQQLSVCLPMGYRLVIKDHGPGVGSRSINYYRQLARLPNLVFADYRLKGTDLAAGAECIATISGTIGYEASLMGKPVITFTERTVYDWLPNVIFVKNIRDLPSYLRDALRVRSEEEVSEIRRQAAFLYEGVKATSFDATGSTVFKGGQRELTKDELDQAYGLLLRNSSLQRKVFGWKPGTITSSK